MSPVDVREAGRRKAAGSPPLTAEQVEAVARLLAATGQAAQ